MKNWSPWALICVVLACVVGYVIAITFTGIIFLNIATSPANETIRNQLIELVKVIALSLLAIAGAMVINNKNDKL